MTAVFDEPQVDVALAKQQGMTAEEIRALIDHRLGPRIKELLRHDVDRGATVRNALVDVIA